MFLELLMLSVIWIEVNFADGEINKKDIYELDYWSRIPKFENRRSANKPNFRNGDLGRRIRKPLRDKGDGKLNVKQKSTRIDTRQEDKHDPTHVTKPQVSTKIRTPPDDGSKEDGSDSLEYLSAYSLKQSMEQMSETLGKETNITIEVIGRTFEYNEILILKMAEKASVISKYFRANEDKYIDEAPEKRIIFIVHALTTKGIRQLPCLTRNKRFMQLLNYYLDHLDQFDIYLIPVANPDGYTETFNDPHWIKNMAPQGTCHGVALDRNFDVAWGTVQVTGPCSYNFPGPTAFSEPETRAIRDVLHRYGHKIIAYIHVHAGSFIPKTFRGEAVLYPKGYTEAQTDDDKYMDMKGEIDEAMRNASFQRMTVTTDTLYHWYGKVAGTSVDYASTVFGIPYAMEFVMETYEENELQKAALSAIWKRVIDAVFNFIHKRGDGGEAQQNL